MALSDDERELLRRIAQSTEPVAPSDYFHEIHPPTFDQNAPDNDPDREAWNELQISLYGAYIKLWESGLIEVANPANGEQRDLMRVTAAGRTALA